MLLQGDAQRPGQGGELFVKLTKAVAGTGRPLQPRQAAHGLDRRQQTGVVQPRLTQRTAQGVEDHHQRPVDALLAMAGATQAEQAVVQVADFGERRADAGHVVLEILAVSGAWRIGQTPGGTGTVGGTTGMAVANAGAKQTGDVGRMFGVGQVQVVVEVVAGAIEKQADVHGLAAGWQYAATCRDAQCIVVVTFLTVLAMQVLLDLRGPGGQAALQRELRRVPDGGVFHF
ncbi:hypothetical protein D3C73_542980 [compost metagenome]